MVLVMGFPPGCNSGPPNKNHRLSPTAVASIRNGITTKGQVRELLGPPQAIIRQVPLMQPAGAPPLPIKMTASEIWDYGIDMGTESSLFTTAVAGGSRYLVTIFFDARGVVLDCQTGMTGS